MSFSDEIKRQPRRSRRRQVVALIAFYVIAFTGTIPFIETGDGGTAQLARIHAEKAVSCRHFARRAQAEGRVEDAQRLDQSAQNHDWFAAVHRRAASRTRWTWLTWLIKRAEEKRQDHYRRNDR